MPIMTGDEWFAFEEKHNFAPSITLALESITWRADGADDDPRSVLRAVLEIGPACLTLQAIGVHLEYHDPDKPGEVKTAPMNDADAMEQDGCQIIADRPDIDIVELYRAHEMDGRCDTLEFEGRHYAVFAHPFSG